MLPDRFRQFEKFLASAGVDPNTQVEELAWGLVAEGVTAKTEGVGNTAVPTGEQIVGVALGNYNPESTEAYFKTAEIADVQGRGTIRSTPLAAGRVRTICFSSSSTRALRRLAIAHCWRR